MREVTDGKKALRTEVQSRSEGFWGRKKVFVTGATGLVGSWLVRELMRAGADVVALIRDWDPRSELVRSGLIARIAVVSRRLEDLAAIERALVGHEIDTVFHLGAQTIVGAALLRNGAEAEIRHQHLNADKARRVLAWLPQFTFEQGVARSILWYREFFRSAA